jgi:hypothetical protein
MQITDNLTLTLQFSMGLILVKFEEKIFKKYPSSCSEKKSNLFFMKKKYGLGGQHIQKLNGWFLILYISIDLSLKFH